MKIKSVHANNRKKAFEITTLRGEFLFPYVRANPAPSRDNAIESVVVDRELGREAFTYSLASGVEGTVHIDNVLEYNRDPQYLRDQLLYRLTLIAQRRVHDSPLSRRELIRRMGTSPSQFCRLLDQTNYKKSLDSLTRLLYILDCEIDIHINNQAITA